MNTSSSRRQPPPPPVEEEDDDYEEYEDDDVVGGEEYDDEQVDEHYGEQYEDDGEEYEEEYDEEDEEYEDEEEEEEEYEDEGDSPGLPSSGVKTDQVVDEMRRQAIAGTDGPQLSDFAWDELRAAFKLFDHDRDGKISVAELGEALRAFGADPKPDEVYALAMEIDLDRDGTISFDEFARALAPRISTHERSVRRVLERAFRESDKDGDGFLSKVDLQGMLQHISGKVVPEDDISRIIATIEAVAAAHTGSPSDGLIDRSEFMYAMAALLAYDLRNMVFDAAPTSPKDEPIGQQRISQVVDRDRVPVDSSGIDPVIVTALTTHSAFSALRSLAKSLRPSPLDYIEAFGFVPQSFRPSFLAAQLASSRERRPSSAVLPHASSQHVALMDMIPTYPTLGIAPTHAINLRITLERARGVPLPVRRMKNVIARRIRVTFYDTVKGTVHGNIHTIPAAWRPQVEDEWTFSPTAQVHSLRKPGQTSASSASPVGQPGGQDVVQYRLLQFAEQSSTFLVRTNYAHPMSILFELSVVMQRPKENLNKSQRVNVSQSLNASTAEALKKHRGSSVSSLLSEQYAQDDVVEMSCGFALLELPAPNAVNGAPMMPPAKRTLRLPLVGGAVGAFTEIPAAEVLARRAGWRRVQQMLGGPPRPSLSLIVESLPQRTLCNKIFPAKMGTISPMAAKLALAQMPVNVVLPLAALPFVAEYRNVIHATLFGNTKARLPLLQMPAVVHDPFLASFPLVLDEPLALDALCAAWERRRSAWLRKNKRDPAFCIAQIRQLVLQLSTIFHSKDLPPMSDRFSEQAQKRFEMLERATDLNAPSMLLRNDDDLTYEPFVISETEVDVVPFKL